MQRLLFILILVALGLFSGCGGDSASDNLLQPGKTGQVGVGSEDAVDGDVDPQVWDELTARLAGQLASRGASGLAPEVPPGAAGFVDDLKLELTGETTAELSWGYVNRGDYNQDGLVSGGDLTPVGIHYQSNVDAPDWADASRADGNGDGHITAADVTVIGQNYLHRVDGYFIEESATPEIEVSWQLLLNVPFTSSAVEQGNWRLGFSSAGASLKQNMYYRVVPFVSIAGVRSFGNASDLVHWASTVPAAPATLAVSDGSFVGSVILQWTASPTASYYLVYRDYPGNLIGQTVSTTYADCLTGDYSAHEYWVRAGNACGEGELSEGDMGFSGLATPVELSASEGSFSDRVELTWERVNGAGGYAVFRDTGSTPVGVAGDVDHWTDNDVDQLLHSYRVRAVNLLGSSLLSNAELGYTRSSATGTWNQAGANAQHSYSTATVGPENPELKWTKYFNTTAHSNPALSLDEATVYVGSRDNRVHAFNRITREHQWSFTTTDDVIAQPVVNADGQILVGNIAGKFYCINPDGTEAWHYNAPGAINHRAAVADAGAVYLAAGDTLTCLNPGGRPYWSFDCAGQVIGHPVVHTDGNAYVSTAYNLRALDPLGNERWRYTDAAHLFASPALDNNGDIYFNEFSETKYRLVRLNSAGEVAWWYGMGFSEPCTPVVSSSGMVYAANRVGCFDGEDVDQLLHAINPDGTRAWTAGRHYVDCQSEVVLGPYGNIYICNFDSWHTLECYSPAGVLLWWLADESFFSDRGSIPLVTTEGMILMTDNSGSLLSIVPNAGDPESYLQISADGHEVEHLAGEPVFSSDGTVFICGDELRVLNPAGDELWSDGYVPMVGAAVDAAGIVYAAGGRVLYAYAADGTRLWEISGDDTAFDRPPVLSDSLLYFRSGRVINTDGSSAWETGEAVTRQPVVSSNGQAYWLSKVAGSQYNLTAFNSGGNPSNTTALIGNGEVSGLAVDTAGMIRVRYHFGLIESYDAWLRQQWQAEPDGYGTSYSGIAVDRNGAVYSSNGLGSSRRVLAVSASGEILWSVEHSERCMSNLVVDGVGCIYFCDNSGYLFSLNADGSERWRLDLTDADVKSLSLSPDGTLYVVGPHENLLAVGNTG